MHTSIVKKRRTWKKAPIKKKYQSISENQDQLIEKIEKDGRTALAITYKKNIALKNFPFLKKATNFLSSQNIPVSQLLSYEHTKNGYRGIWTFCEGKVRNTWSVEDYNSFGIFLGNMHSVSRSYQENNIQRSPLIFKIRNEYEKIKYSIPSSFLHIEGLLDEIEKKWPIFLPTGLVHTDLFCNNILFQQQGCVWNFTKS